MCTAFLASQLHKSLVTYKVEFYETTVASLASYLRTALASQLFTYLQAAANMY